MAKDSFQEFIDSITLIRDDMRNLQRTSLSKDEAKALNSHVAQVLAQMKAVASEMTTAASEAPQLIRKTVRQDLHQIDYTTSQAASAAAQQAVEGLRTHLDVERMRFAQAAGDARREAWRYFGGFWVWLGAMLATGALLGALAMAYFHGRDDARAFAENPDIFCRSAGGQRVEQQDGSSFCAVWIDKAVQATK